MKVRHTLCLFLILSLVGVAAASAQVASRFNEDSEGWTLVNLIDNSTAVPLYSPGEGELGGYIYRADTSSERWYWRAPEKYHGDNSDFYGKYLVYSMTTDRVDVPFEAPDLILEGSGIRLVHVGFQAPRPTWSTYVLGLNEFADWRVQTTDGPPPTSQQFATVLASVSDLLIRAKFYNGPDRSGLDHVFFGTDDLGGVEDGEQAGGMSLATIAPNPFASTTTIRYTLAAAGPVAVTVHDVFGREVARPVDGMGEPGEHAATFDGSELPSGVYLCRLTGGGKVVERRMVVAR